MTSASLTDILTAINQYDPHHVLTGALAAPAPTGGSTTTLVDNLRLLDNFRGSIYEGGYVTFNGRTGSNRHRRIETDTPSTGTWLWSAPLGDGVVTTADTYLAWTLLNPMRVEGAVNRCLERMRYVEQVDITGVADQRQYSLASDFPWLTHVDDVLAVRLRNGDTALRYTYPALPRDYWQVTQDNAAFTLNLLGPTYASTDTLRVDTLRPYANPLEGTGYLATGANTTTAPLRWVVAEALLELLQTMSALEWGPEPSLLAMQAAKAEAEAREWRTRMKQNVPSPPVVAPGRSWSAAIGSVW